jgi:hypothetical protein
MSASEDQPNEGLIKKSKAIEALRGQELREIEQCSDPEIAGALLSAWNEAVGDCIKAIEKL